MFSRNTIVYSGAEVCVVSTSPPLRCTAQCPTAVVLLAVFSWGASSWLHFRAHKSPSFSSSPLLNVSPRIFLPGRTGEDVRCPRCQLKESMGRRSCATKLVAALHCAALVATSLLCSASSSSSPSYYSTSGILGEAYYEYSVDGCLPAYIGDGFCDDANNQAACQYDSGDVSRGHPMLLVWSTDGCTIPVARPLNPWACCRMTETLALFRYRFLRPPPPSRPPRFPFSTVL